MTAVELNDEATRLMRESRDAEALALQERACELARSENLGPATHAALLSNLALLQRRVGQPAAAQAGYEAALAAMREAGPGHEANVAQICNNLAVLVGQQGRFEQARAYLEEAAALRERIGDRLGLAETYVNLASLHSTALQPEQAAARLQDAMRECESVTEQAPVDLSAVLEVLPEMQAAFRRDDQLLARSNERRMADLINTRAVDPGKAADVLLQIGRVAHDLAEIPLAERAVRRALDMRRRAFGDEHPSLAPALSLLGSISEETGDLASAEALHLGAVDVTRAALGDGHPETTKARFGLAGLYLAKRQLPEAEQLYLSVADHLRNAPGDTRAALAGVLTNTAEVQILSGRHEEARELQLEALEMYRATLGDRHRTVGTVLHNLGKTQMALGNLADAQQRLRAAVDITDAALGAEHPEARRTRITLAVLLAATARDDEALQLLLETTRVGDRMIEATSSVSSSRRRLAFLWDINRELSMLVSLVVARLRTSPAARRAAFELVVRRKARGLEATAAQRRAVHTGRHPELDASLRRLDRMRSELAAGVLGLGAPSGDEDARARAGEIQRLAWEADRLEAELSAALPEAHLSRAGEITMATVAAALPADAALVEILSYRPYLFDPAQPEAWGPWRYVAFVLTGASEDVALADLGPSAELDELLADVLDAMSGRQTRDAGAADGRAIALEQSTTSASRLREAVLDPVLAATGSATHLIVAPDGNLSRLPFAVLPTADRRYLIDDFRVSYVGVGRDLVDTSALTDRTPDPPMVVAAPDFDRLDPEPAVGATALRGIDAASGVVLDLQRSGVRFGPLRGALSEGQAVADVLGVEPLVGSAARESTVVRARSPVVLHLATHGWFLPPPSAAVDAPDPGRVPLGAAAGHSLLRSGLALAGANRRIDGLPLPDDAGDGLLRALDVLAMDLVDTELVVLSACDTGLGDVRNGEGVFGLRRAFQEAGARTVVMSLWKVPDDATRELMVEFYVRVAAAEPVVDALRDAQLDVRKRHPHPRNWGAFICQGRSGPMVWSPPTAVSAIRPAG